MWVSFTIKKVNYEKVITNRFIFEKQYGFKEILLLFIAKKS